MSGPAADPSGNDQPADRYSEGDAYHPHPLDALVMAPPRLGQRYGLMPLLVGNAYGHGENATGPVVEETGTGYHSVAGPPVLDHPQQTYEHERENTTISDLAHAVNVDSGGVAANTLNEVHGVLLHLLDAMRDLKPREPIDVPSNFGQTGGVAGSTYGITDFLMRNGRRHILLWCPTTGLIVTLGGAMPLTSLTLKAGWNVLDCPDNTSINLTTPTAAGVVTFYRCCDEVPAGLVSN